MIGEHIQEQTGQVSQIHRDENTRGAIESNTGNQHNTASNNTNIPQVPEERSENSQNYFQVKTQPNVNTPQHAVPSQNRNKFSNNSRRSLTQFHLIEPKTQIPQKNGEVRRNIMRSGNNAQNWESQNVHLWEMSRREPQDVCMWETSRAHQQNNWWSTNQPDTTSCLQLPLRKFQEQRRHIVNYKEEEDLSWCNKCGEPGHIRAWVQGLL